MFTLPLSLTGPHAEQIPRWQCQCADNWHRWWTALLGKCPYGQPQIMNHIGDLCPLTKTINDGLHTTFCQQKHGYQEISTTKALTKS